MFHKYAKLTNHNITVWRCFPSGSLAFLGVLFLLNIYQASGQTVINGYAKVTNIAGTTITLSDVDETNDRFEVGENLIIMQMQDDVIGANTGDDPSFGDVSDIGSAGLYEMAEIQSVSRTSNTQWSEDFQGANMGWSVACSGGACIDPVLYNNGGGDIILLAQNTDADNGNYSYWLTNPIDISSYAYIDLSATFLQLGLDPEDSLVAGYYLDGSPSYIRYDQGVLRDSFADTTLSASNISGTSIRLVVFFITNAADDYAGINNIVVTGYSSATSLEVTLSLTESYSTGANASVQVITYPESVNFSTTDDLTAIDWDGNIGGVLAMEVTNTLTLNHNINLDGKGFRGGGLNTLAESSSDCYPAVYRTNDGEYGRKGEGIYKNTTALYEGARGKLANGGGGGSKHNSGGGGGGNFTAGGLGGPGYNNGAPADGCDDDPSGDAGTGAGGYGGADLSHYISASRLFLGGGGGGGQQDGTTGDSEAGGDGGGIVLIKATNLDVPCGTGVSITSNGEGFPLASGDAGAEGAPGAGSGGTIIFQVVTYNLTCPLATEAMGGEGQSAVDPEPHGGGGGGGKGVTIFSGSVPSTNYTADNSQGAGGSNGTNGYAGSADSGDTSPGNGSYDPDGMLESQEGPLPVELLYWGGEDAGSYNMLKWATSSELNNQFFTVERSFDGHQWTVLTYVEGSGTSKVENFYDYADFINHTDQVYYRLTQTDFDGQQEVFKIIVVKPEIEETNLLLYPNPSDGRFMVQLSSSLSDMTKWRIYDSSGIEVNASFTIENSKVLFNMENFAPGQYLLKMSDGENFRTLRIMLE
ncbi:MAG: T9SS type A sorting domain-containing protein [Marinoscillum sp.]|uniref:T9SS type A sorting domain-containing protein n=1 Tax=Marinoscillum sp. TaxID=2024838 RepID=UPI0032FE104A